MIESFRPGIYRRRIVLQSQNGAAHADLEDDPHRMSIVVHHDGTRVTAVTGVATRTPWLLCPTAADELQVLIGTPLASDVLTIARWPEAKQQCTHLFDLALLTIAHAGRRASRREYEIEAPWHRLDEPRTITLLRDGVPLWTWTLDAHDRILAPEPFAGVATRHALTHGERMGADRDTLEALFITRRAVLISSSRKFDLDKVTTASEVGVARGACYAYSVERAEHALRRVGSTHDFTHERDALLRGC